MNDEKIIEMLRSGQDTAAFKKLYDHLPKVEEMIRKNSGDRNDARDVFQDALLILHRKAKQDLQLSASLGTYLYGICRNLWFDELRRRKKQPSTDLDANVAEPNAQQDIHLEERQFLLAEKALRSIGKKCQEILVKFYIDRSSMQDIARMLGFSSVNTAKTRKYKCLEQAKKQLRTLSASAIEPIEKS